MRYSVIRGTQNFVHESFVESVKDTPAELRKALQKVGIDAYNFRRNKYDVLVCSDRNQPLNKKIVLHEDPLMKDRWLRYEQTN